MGKMTKKVLMLTLMAVGLLFSGLAGTALAADPGYKVMVNGETVIFTDAQPQNVDGRIMVPFRNILETLGAEVSWDQSSKTVTAKKDDTTISFALGQSAIAIEKDGESRTIQMDAVPFADAGRTYVGSRFMAEAFDYTVGWDAPNRTVVMIDFDQIFANADQDFSILCKMTQSDEDYMNKTYKTLANFDVAVTLAEALTGGQTMKVAADGDITSVQKGLNAEAVLNLSIHADDLVKGEELSEEDTQMLEMLKNIKIAMKVDGASGDVYMNSELFAMMYPDYDKNTWMKTNGYEVYEQMGIDMAKVTDLAVKMEMGNVGLREVLLMAAQENAANLTVETYQAVAAAYDICKEIFGDDAFTTQTSGDKNVYTLSLNGADVAAEVLKNADLKTILQALTAQDRSEMNNALKNVDFTLVFTEQDGKRVQSEINLDVNIPEIKLNYALNQGEQDGTLVLVMEMPELMTIECNMDTSIKETNEKVSIALPANAKVIDLDETAEVEEADLAVEELAWEDEVADAEATVETEA